MYCAWSCHASPSIGIDLIPRCGIVRGAAEIGLAQPRICRKRGTRAFQNNAPDFEDVAAVRDRQSEPRILFDQNDGQPFSLELTDDPQDLPNDQRSEPD